LCFFSLTAINNVCINIYWNIGISVRGLWIMHDDWLIKI
jgi:hypothetical protein